MNSIRLNALFSFIFAFSIGGANAQHLTISTGGQTGTSGTNWSITGNTLNVASGSVSANIHPSVITDHLNNVGDLTVVLPWVSGIPRDLYINASIVYTGANPRTLTFNIVNDLIAGSGISITSSSAAMNLVLRTAMSSSNTDHGRIQLNGTTIDTKGGHFWAGGGSNTATWNGLTVGDTFARTWADDVSGISFIGSTLTTSGGDLYMGGLSYNTSDADGQNYGVNVRNSSLTTGAGAIKIEGGINGKYDTGGGLGIFGNEGPVTISTTTGAINLTGAGTDASGTNNGWRRALLLYTFSSSPITITSVSGHITLSGTAAFNASTTDDIIGVQMGSVASIADGVKITSQTGNISITGSTTRENAGQNANAVQFIAANADNSIRIGYDGTNAYSGNITIEGNSIIQNNVNGGSGSISIKSTGTLTIQPKDNTFTYLRAGASGTLTFDDDWDFGSSLSSFTFGKSTNTLALSYTSPLTVAGPITFHTGAFTINENITASVAANITINATDNFNTDNVSRQTITSNGGNVSIIADSDASGSGVLDLDRLTINPGSGNILVRGETFSWGTDQASVIPILNGSGSLTIESSDNSFGQGLDLTAWIKMNDDGSKFLAITIGKTTNTAAVAFGVNPGIATSSVVTNGPITVYSGNFSISQDVNTTAGGSAGNVFIKASGDIVLEDNKSITTDVGNVILWANSDGGTTNGGVFLDQSSSIATGGGHIWIGGGSGSTTWNGLTVGVDYAVSGRNLENDFAVRGADKINWDAGVLLNETSLNSGGGNIYIAGQRNTRNNHDGGAGIINYSGNSGTTINASTGTVEILASGDYSGHITYGFMTGLHPTQVTGGLTITSTNATATDAIYISASTLTTDNAGLFVEGNTQFLSTAAASGGGISIDASSAAGTGWGTWVQVGSLNVLSASGAINLNAGNSGLGLHPSTGTGFLYLGSKAGTSVTSSTADLTITADRIVTNTGSSINVASSGSLTVEPAAASFSESVSNNQWVLGTDLTALTIGKQGNMEDISIDLATTIAGPISIYGGNIPINQNLNTTGGSAAGDILLKASGDIVLNSGKSVTTAGGDVTFWSDSDISNSGYIQIADNATVTTTGGNIILAGGADDGANNGTASDGLPDGYAVGYGTSPYYFGVGIGKEISSSATNEGASVFSGGGDIIIRGKSGTSTSGTGVVNGSTIDSGAGTICIFGDGNSNGHGIELGANAGSGDQTVTIKSSGGNVTTTAITISGSTTKTGQIGILSGYDYNAAHGIQILSTGTGGIVITGSSTNAGVNGSIAFNGTSVLSASGPVSIDAGTKKLNLAGVKAGTAASAAVYFGSAQSTNVTSSVSNIIITTDQLSTTNPGLAVNSTGALTVQPSGTSFSNALSWPINNFSVTGITGLQLGKAGNTANITIGSTTTIAGPITLYGGNLALNGALTATNSSMNLHATGAVTQSAALTANGLGLHGTGAFTLTNTSNNVATIAGGDNTTKLGSVSYVDASGGLTIGTVNPSGITASGPILIETLTGDITVSNSVTTTNTTADAIIINAGKSSAIGTSAGGDIKISGSPTVMTGMGGIAKLFSGSESASTGLTTLAGGSANVRGQVDETSTSFIPPLQGDNVYALYRVASLPGAPTNLVATPCVSQVTVSFTAGSDGGAPITNYEYTLDGTNWTTFSPAVTGTTVTITALASGTYNISLRAVNSNGFGVSSTTVTATIDNTVTVTYTAVTLLTATNKSAQINLSATVTLPAGANASQQAQLRFINRHTGQPISGWLSMTGSSNTGTASYAHTLTLGTNEIFRKFKIGFEVGGAGCFTRDNGADDVIITVAEPSCGCY